MTFVPTTEGELIDLNNVIGAWPMTPTSVELVVNGGETFHCDRIVWKTITGATRRHFVAAGLGTYLLRYSESDGRVSSTRDPILAWAIEGTGEVTPVIASGMVNLDTRAACLHPDGSVSNAIGTYEDVSTWLYGVAPNERRVMP